MLQITLPEVKRLLVVEGAEFEIISAVCDEVEAEANGASEL